MINFSVLEREIEHYRRCSKENWEWVAAVVAGDILRHLNPMELEEATQYIEENYPRLAHCIKMNFPHRWAA